MTSGTSGSSGDGWAKTVVEGISEGASGDDAPSGEVGADDVVVDGDTPVADLSDLPDEPQDNGQGADGESMSRSVDTDVDDPDEVEAEVEVIDDAEPGNDVDGSVAEGDPDEVEFVDEDDPGEGDEPAGVETEDEVGVEGDSEVGQGEPAETLTAKDGVADDGAADRLADGASVEDLVADLERVSTERDQYLDASRRLQAEFENYKKQVAKRESNARERANDSLVGELLPVLDAFDGAMAAGTEDVGPMRATILDALGKQGLERIDPSESPFDPNLHEAVLHEDDDAVDGPIVAEVMRAGYAWKGRVLRPAMVKTRG